MLNRLMETARDLLARYRRVAMIGEGIWLLFSERHQAYALQYKLTNQIIELTDEDMDRLQEAVAAHRVERGERLGR